MLLPTALVVTKRGAVGGTGTTEAITELLCDTVRWALKLIVARTDVIFAKAFT